MGKAKRFNSYDSEVDTRRKIAQEAGVERQKLSVGSSFRNMPLTPPKVAVSPASAGTGTGTFATSSLSADQTTNIAANDHVEFDTLDEDGGITLQTGAGQADGIFELKSGKKYQLSAHLRPEFSGATGQLVIAWYDITNTAEIGSRAIYESQTHASHNANQPVAEAIITPTANITVEVRIIAVTALTALANEYCVANLFEIALGGSSGASGGGGGGGSGVSFPITPTINDHGNVGTTTEDLDLSASTGHVHKITLTGNPTLTFSNPPSSGTQIEFEIEFVQDGTGGRTVTFPASVAETISISGVANATTIVTFRTNDGGTTYHGIPALRGSISLSGGTEVFTWTGDHSAGSFDLTNLDRLRFVADSGSAASVSDPTIYLSSTGDMKFNVATGDSFIKTINDTEEYKFTATALEMNGNDLTEVNAIAANQDGVDDIGSTSKSFDGLYIDTIEFQHDEGAPTANAYEIGRDGSSDLYINWPTGEQLVLYENGVSKWVITDTAITGANITLTGALTFDDSSTDPSANGQIQRNGTDLKAYSGGNVVNFSSIATFPTSDANSIVEGSVDATKELRLEVDGLTTATIRVWTVQDTDLTVAGLDAAQTFTAAQSFDNVAKLEMRTNITADTTGHDIADSTNYFQDIFLERVRFPANTTVTSNAFNIVRKSISSVDSMNLNVPTGRNIVLSENGTTQAVFNFVSNYLDLQQAGGINQYRITPSSGSIFSVSKAGSGAATFVCSDNFDFLTGDVTVSNDFACNGIITADLDLDIAATVDFNLNSTTASAGSQTLPSNPVGFVIIKVNGTSRKVPFYAS
jgi:hypothetical protein